MTNSYPKKSVILRSVSIFSILGLLVSVVSGLYLFAQNNYQAETQVLGASSGKDGYTLRFNTNANGGLVFTGNSLCLSEGGIHGAHGSCKTYTTADLKNDSKYNLGTTQKWQENSGISFLNIPKGSEVLYAELIWGGNYSYLDQSIENKLNTSIGLETPEGEYSISPDKKTAKDVINDGSYVRTAEVTDIVKAGGSGYYRISSVPSLMVEENPYNNYVGYTLAVAYKDDSEPVRNLSIFVGSELTSADQFTNTAEITGFSTPTSGSVDGKLFVSAMEGDSMSKGDKMRFGATPQKLKDLSSPNNKKDNFFASQINSTNGKLDKSGSYGGANQKVGKNNIADVRQGWDVTAANISNNLTTNQTTAYAQSYSAGDIYIVNALGMQIDVNAANPEIDLEVLGNKETVCKGETIGFKADIVNAGTADSYETVLTSLEAEGTTLIANSVTVNGSSYNYKDKIVLDTLKASETKTVEFELKVEEKTTLTRIENSPSLSYKYTMFAGLEQSNKINSRGVSLEINDICNPQKEEEELKQEEPKDKTEEVANPETAVSDVIIEQKEEDPETNSQQEKLDGNQCTIDSEITYSFDGEMLLGNKVGMYRTDVYKFPQVVESGDYKVVLESYDNHKPHHANQELESFFIEFLDESGNVIVSSDSIPDLPSELTRMTKVVNQSLAISGDVYSYRAVHAGYPDIEGPNSIVPVCLSLEKIEAEPQPPVALDDTRTTEKNVEIDIDVLKNDSDPDNDIDTSTLVQVTEPKKGTITIKDGKFVYTPNKDYTGTDTFEYKICDQTNLCDKAVVKIVIKEGETEPQPPVALDDKGSTDKNIPIIIPVINNDTDPDDNLDNSSLKITNPPLNGKVIIKNGEIVYTPNKDYTGTDAFEYEICDLTGLCDTAKVEVKVLDTVELLPPVAKNDEAVTEVNQKVLINLILNDTDADGFLDVKTLEVINEALNGTVEIENDGTVYYTPNKDYTGTDTFEYKICDNDGLCDTAMVEVKIIDNQKPEERPVVAGDDEGETKKDTSVIISVSDNDTLDTVVTEITQKPTNGTVKIVDGEIEYTPNEGYVGGDVFEYSTCINNNCDTAKVNVNVKPAGLVLGDSDNLVRSGGFSLIGVAFFGSATILSLFVLNKSKRRKMRVNPGIGDFDSSI